MAYVVLSTRVLLGAVFAASALTKLRSADAFAEFTASVGRLGRLPASRVRPAAMAVAAGEVTVPVLLAVPAAGATGLGFALAAVLLTAFAVAIARSLRRGPAPPCRCFGSSSTPIGRHHVARNLVLIAAATAGVLGVVVSAGAGEAVTTPAGAAVAAASGLVAALFTITLDDLVDLLKVQG
jgi:hypothetical protein